ncbi:15360_t:CDS:1 [Acaulospora colombiana]|uniref:15360_t:CDS:1 n=1 Tax=Acaulospora colombiana TaxID=27376 RepID=A0ACA9L7M7_9GLOM|nr:15360_t:CDS:1 [Acaulospora colombiana]
MSTSAISNYFSSVKNLDTENLIIFLREQNLNLDEDDFRILHKQKMDGQIFLEMTKEKFMEDGMKPKSAIKLENQAKVFKKGRIEYFWLFSCDVWSKQHFTVYPGPPIFLALSREM